MLHIYSLSPLWTFGFDRLWCAVTWRLRRIYFKLSFRLRKMRPSGRPIANLHHSCLHSLDDSYVWRFLPFSLRYFITQVTVYHVTGQSTAVHNIHVGQVHRPYNTWTWRSRCRLTWTHTWSKIFAKSWCMDERDGYKSRFPSSLKLPN